MADESQPLSPQVREGHVVVGRYALRRLLGRGGHGEVWEAEDRLTRGVVAVKLLRGGFDVEPARVRREILALRVLRLPGVVQLLDEGLDEGRPFFVMERVDGAPFPGEARRGSWAAIAEVTVALLETLARIHAAGVIHRDLKPENVLVNAEGRPTVLDFGISAGARLGSSLTRTGYVLGTPQYLAPEQIVGEQATARTDLYALGLLLYEALAGGLPHDARERLALWQARLAQRSPPLRSRAPEVPHAVAGVIDLLLAREPEQRPRSAQEVLSILRGQTTVELTGPTLPRLDGRAPVDALLRAVRAGRAADLIGPHKAGRSRCLEEVAAALRHDGVRVAWAVPGRRAFASLEPVLGSLDEPVSGAGRRLSEVVEVVEERLRSALEGGLVVLVDDADRLDRWSASAVARCWGAGAVVRVLPAASPAGGEGRSVVRLEPLDELALQRLFAGPERLFHLRADAARALWVRTEGLQARVAEEIHAWLRAGIARWDGALLVVDRDTLDRLESGLRVVPPQRDALSDGSAGRALSAHLEELASWIAAAWPVTQPDLLAAAMGLPVWRVEADIEDLLRSGAVRRLPDGRVEPTSMTQAELGWSAERRRFAHRAIAEALLPGAEGRLGHMTAGMGEEGADAIDVLEVAREAGVLARRLAEEGRLGHALAALAEGLLFLRRGAAPEHAERAAVEVRLLALWVEVALSERTPQAYDRVLYELSRAEPRTEDVAHLEALVRAAVAYVSGGDRAITQLDEVAPFEDLELERHRQSLRVLAARRCPQEREEAVLDGVAAWASRVRDAVTHARLAGWVARVRYRQGRFEEAARLQGEAAATDPWATERIAARINGASALMEAFLHDEAASWAADALAQARRCRHAFYEARAEWILRSMAYRGGAATSPDLELVEAAARLGVGDLEASICLNEAAVAYRAGQHACAIDLSGRALHVWTLIDDHWPALLVRCLALAAGARPESRREIDALSRRAMQCEVTGLGLQALGLLARARGGALSAWRSAAAPLTDAIPRCFWHLRMDVSSVDEALESLESRPAGARRSSARGRSARPRSG